MNSALGMGEVRQFTQNLLAWSSHLALGISNTFRISAAQLRNKKKKTSCRRKKKKTILKTAKHTRTHTQAVKRRKCGSGRTLAPTLFLQPDYLGVGAEAVPRRAVVDGLEVGRHDVAHGQRGDDALLRGHGLHRVAARRARL